MLNMAEGHHLQLKCSPVLLPNFRQFNNADMAHCPIIQKQVDELFSKGAIEPSTGGGAIYSSVFVIPMHAGGL